MLSHPYLTEVLVSDRHLALLAAAPSRRRTTRTEATTATPATAAGQTQMAGFRAALALALGRRAVRALVTGARSLPGVAPGPPVPCEVC